MGLLKKLTIPILMSLAITSVFTIIQVPKLALAGDNVTDSFNVNEYLTIPDEEGGTSDEQSYMNEDEPIVAFILDVINFLMKVIGTITIILIIIGGVMMLASQGDDNMIQKGKTVIKQAFIGLILALFSYVLVTFVQSLLYVNG